MSRPKPAADVGSLARAHTKSAIRTLGTLSVNAENESVRQAAAVSLLSFGWGKPSQTTKHTGADGEGPIIVQVMYQPRETKK